MSENYTKRPQRKNAGPSLYNRAWGALEMIVLGSGVPAISIANTKTTGGKKAAEGEGQYDWAGKVTMMLGYDGVQRLLEAIRRVEAAMAKGKDLSVAVRNETPGSDYSKVLMVQTPFEGMPENSVYFLLLEKKNGKEVKHGKFVTDMNRTVAVYTNPDDDGNGGTERVLMDGPGGVDLETMKAWLNGVATMAALGLIGMVAEGARGAGGGGSDDEDGRAAADRPKRGGGRFEGERDEGQPKTRKASSLSDADDEDEDDEQFSGKKGGVPFEDDEDDAPKTKKTSKKSSDDDDEDEVPKAKKSAKKSSDDDEDEDDAPKAKKTSKKTVNLKDDDEDEDDVPKAKKTSKKTVEEDDGDDEDEAPKAKKTSKKTVEEDEDDDEVAPKKSAKKTSKKSSLDDDEDED